MIAKIKTKIDQGEVFITTSTLGMTLNRYRQLPAGISTVGRLSFVIIFHRVCSPHCVHCCRWPSSVAMQCMLRAAYTTSTFSATFGLSNRVDFGWQQLLLITSNNVATKITDNRVTIMYSKMLSKVSMFNFSGNSVAQKSLKASKLYLCLIRKEWKRTQRHSSRKRMRDTA